METNMRENGNSVGGVVLEQRRNKDFSWFTHDKICSLCVLAGSGRHNLLGRARGGGGVLVCPTFVTLVYIFLKTSFFGRIILIKIC